MSLSNYIEISVLTHLLQGVPWMKPPAIYVALFTADPGEAGALTAEVAGGGYARVQAGPSDSAWTLPAEGDKTFTNAADIAFPAPTAAWGAVTHFGLVDGATGGTMLASGALDTATAINSGAPAPTFAAGTLRVPFSGHLSDALAEAIGTHLLRTGEWTPPAALYAGLLTSDGTEPTAADYARQPAGPSPTAWAEPSATSGTSNAEYLVWPSPAEDWTAAASVALFDAATEGAELMRIPLAAPVALPAGALAPNFPPGALTIAAN